MKSRACLYLLILHTSWVASHAFSDEFYTVAAFEHAVQGNWTEDAPSDIIQSNLAYFDMAAKEANEKGADIIVFPEYGIFPFAERDHMKQVIEHVPDPREGRINPCQDPDNYSNSTILRSLSCMAKKYDIVVVANMADIQPCLEEPNCPDDRSYHFNTNVAFDSDGALIGRYHKEHLFFEKGMDLPVAPQDPTFQTGFGKFAMFVCFDIVFKRITEFARTDIAAVLLPTMWIDPAPMMTSVQLWQSWAMGNNITFVAANVQMPGFFAVGSGVFDGENGPIAYSYNPDGLSKLIVARVNVKADRRRSSHLTTASTTVITRNGSRPYKHDGDRVPEQCSRLILGQTHDRYRDYRCLEEDLSNYTLVRLNNTRDSILACSNGLCCSLDYETDHVPENFYFGAYNGTYNMFDRYFWSVENCLLVRCDPFEGVPCKTFPMRSGTKFNRVVMMGNFTTDHVYPSVVESGMRLTSPDSWRYRLHLGHAVINYQNSTGAELIVVGLNGRAYDRDPLYVR